LQLLLLFERFEFLGQARDLRVAIRHLAFECEGTHRFVRESMPFLTQLLDALFEFLEMRARFVEDTFQRSKLIRFARELPLKISREFSRLLHIILQCLAVGAQFRAQIGVSERLPFRLRHTAFVNGCFRSIGVGHGQGVLK
jgi:hypothetical protein